MILIFMNRFDRFVHIYIIGTIRIFPTLTLIRQIFLSEFLTLFELDFLTEFHKVIFVNVFLGISSKLILELQTFPDNVLDFWPQLVEILRYAVVQLFRYWQIWSSFNIIYAFVLLPLGVCSYRQFFVVNSFLKLSLNDWLRKFLVQILLRFLESFTQTLLPL